MSAKGLCERLEFFLPAGLEIFERFPACAAFFDVGLLAETLRADFALRAAGFFAGTFFFFDLAISQKAPWGRRQKWRLN